MVPRRWVQWTFGRWVVDATAVRDGPELAALSDAWEACRRRAALPRYQEHPDRLRHELARRPNRSLGAVLLREGDEVVGVVPVIEEEQPHHWLVRLPRRTVHALTVPLTTARVPSETLLVPDDDTAHQLALAELLTAHRGADVIHFPGVRTGSRLEQALGTVRAGGDGRWAWHRARPATRLQIRFGAAGGTTSDEASFDDYLAARLHRQERSNLRRDAKRLLASGRATITGLHQPGDVDRFLADAAHVWSRSWHSARGGSFPTGSGTADDLRWLAGRGWFRGYVVHDGAEPVAFLWATMADDTLWIDKMAFDRSWRSLAPGKTVLVHGLREAHEQGCQVVDFGFGDYPYKRVWANAEVAVRPITLVRTRWKPMAACLPSAAYGRMRATTIDAVTAAGLDVRARRFSSRRLGR